MDALIKKCEKLQGEVTVPGSKSYTHRVIAAAALSDGTTLIKNPSHSEANIAMADACAKLGAIVNREGEDYKVVGFGRKPEPSSDVLIDVGNSGTALRLTIALASLANKRIQIDGDLSLRNRPTKPLIDSLNDLYSKIQGDKRVDGNGVPNEYAPVTINAHGLKGGKVSIDGTQSSQYLTSLLLVSPYTKEGATIDVQNSIVSKPYIDMTIEVLKKFGISVEKTDDYRHYTVKPGQKYVTPHSYKIPGDYSQAAFFLAAACLVKSNVTVKGLSLDDKQGDRQIINILEKMGAKIKNNNGSYTINGPYKLKGIPIDLIDAPDLFPVLSVLGVYAEGSTRLYNMPQIRSKETDRIAVIEREFTKCGIKVESKEDEMTVYQTDLPEQEYEFSAKGTRNIPDHRVAMALSLIGIRSGCATIKDAHSVSISYPEYFEHLESLGVKTEVVGEKPQNEVPQRLGM